MSTYNSRLKDKMIRIEASGGVAEMGSVSCSVGNYSGRRKDRKSVHEEVVEIFGRAGDL